MVDERKLPEGWGIKKLSEVAPLQRGFDLPTGKIKKGSYPVVYSNGISNYHNEFKVKGPGVITGRSGTIGKVHYADGNYWPHNTALWVTDFKDNNPRFIYYLYTYVNLEKFATGSGVPTLNRNDVHSFEVLVPSCSEQKSIAEALSDTDNLIQSVEKLIGKKKKIKLGAMQQLLTGRKRLPGFSGKWEDKTIGDLFEITAGGDLDNTSFSQHRTSTHKFPIYSNGLAKDSIYGYSSYSLHSKDAITVTARGTIGHAVYRKDDFIAIGRLLVLKAKYKMNNFMISELINTCVSFSIESTGVPQLTSPQIAKYEIKFPTEIQEQKAIAQVLSDMDAEIEALEEKLEKYKTIKQGMMQELLTGRIRLI